MVRLVSYWILVLPFLAIFFSGSTMADQNKQCTKLFGNFMPCMRFLSSKNLGESPTLECCQGIRKLNEIAQKSRKGPKKICQCLEDMAYSLNIRFVYSQVAALPKNCNVHLNFPISNSMDCSKLNG
ncbi:protein ARABIDOPSIS THALIANA ANTHER 7-like [Mercurialis annua]|uniref:protein ARABIDOPSIS THALIANA ANTHER 7-like n=1 Tax=Mercurialis annua TaxID=3986 RepID=UPI00215EAA5C|nr:protein ARABIDOPSIS THALIANA ANTHER 7-like [Mercurialis annua]